MIRLRKAAARERRAPIVWWLLLMMVTGGALFLAVYHHSPTGAILLAILLAASWVAPLLAFLSLSMPERAKKPAPAPGEGTYAEWLKQARLLGRVLLYYEDNNQLTRDVNRAIHAARLDLRGTLKAHPLRDDLERVCQRIRAGALKEVKDSFAQEYRRDIREQVTESELAASASLDEDQRLVALQGAVSNAAALMTRNCMPRMLERERLACAVDCAWLAVQAAVVQGGQVSPVDLAEMLVIEWSDFSEPWQPARALRLAMERLEHARARSATVPVIEEPRLHRVRVRVRKRKHHHHHHHRRNWHSVANVFLSFGQWVRYSIRAWALYR